MKRLLFLSVLACFLAVTTSEALAWEISLDGEAVWRYRFVTRTGGGDIFGEMNGDEGANLGINHIRDYPTPRTNNAYSSSIGIIAGEHNFGPDMGLTDYRVTFYPTFKVNKAIRLLASINLTSLGIHSSGRPYYNMEMDELGSVDTTGGGYANSLWVPIVDRMGGANVPNTYITVQWAKLKIRMPMIDLSIGYKTGGAAIGLWKSDLDRSSCSFRMSADYGPFIFGISPYFGRAQSNWNTWPRNDRNDHSVWRNEGDRNYFGGLSMSLQYNCGPIEINFAQDGWSTPNWADGTYTHRLGNGTPRNVNINGRPGPDAWTYDTAVGFKYSNSRFFVNAEVSHLWLHNSGRGTTEANGGRVRADIDEDAWIYGVEAGFLAGPSKLTLSYVRATGDDPHTRFTNEDALNADSGVSPNTMIRWGYLMYYVYGTGTGWNAAGEGLSSNFHHVGARMDYSLAANLNVFTVLSYAWRDQANAFWLGGDGSHAALRLTNNHIRTGVPNLAPVPDHAKDIGWEVDFGYDWKLLENLEWNLICALWFPGKFWGYAYPNTAAIYNFSWPNFVAPDYTRARQNPDREIDPIFAMQTSLRVHF